MKTRTTWVLLIVTVAVAGFVAWEFQKGTTTDQARQQRKRLVHFKAAEATGVELVHTNQTVVLQKAGSTWAIQKPYAVRASPGAVNSLLDELELAERERLLADAAPAEFGLDKPWLRITIQRPAGPLTVLVGAETPTRDAYFLQVAGQKEIQVVPKYVVSRLDRSLDDLRDRTVLEVTGPTRLELRNRDRLIELTKTADRWGLSQPLTARADQTKVNALINTLTNLRVLDFVSEDPGAVHAYGLDEPVTEVTVWTGDKGQTVLFGRAPTNDATKVYAKLKSADSVFTVAATAAQEFAVPVHDVRDRQILPVAAADVQTIQIVAAGKELALARTDSVWRVTAPQSLPAEESEVTRLLRQLADLTVQQFVADVPTDLDRFGLATPELTVSLQGQGTNVLLVGGADATNGWRYAKRADEPFVYGVDAKVIASLPVSPWAVRRRQLVDLKPDQIKKLTLQKGGEQVVVERNAAGKWQLVQPAQGILNVEAADRMAETLATLRVEEFLETKPAEAGLDAPVVVVTAEPGTLRLGQPAGAEKRFATWAETVGTVAESTAKIFTVPLVTTPPATNTPPVTTPAP